MNVKLPTEHHLEFLSIKGGCTGLSESTLVKMPHCWKSHVLAQMYLPWDNYQENLYYSSVPTKLFSHRKRIADFLDQFSFK